MVKDCYVALCTGDCFEVYHINTRYGVESKGVNNLWTSPKRYVNEKIYFACFLHGTPE
jgi:hypothetical protein